MNFSVWLTMLQGLIVGVTLMVPGMSGGTMAMVLGAYDRLIQSVSSFRKHKKKSLLFLAAFSVPAVFGMVMLAKPLLLLIQLYEKPMMYFFMGAVAGSIPMIYKKIQMKRLNLKFFLYLIIGIAAVAGVAKIPSGLFGGDYFSGIGYYLIQIAGGIIVAVALVLPGISVSYMLVLMGLYEPTMEAVGNLDVIALLPLIIGCLLGILLTTKLLEFCMNRYPFAAYLIILGFVIGSAAQVFPGIPVGKTLVVCIFTFLAGFFVIYYLSRKEEDLERIS
ncbi:Domain of uncharacterised function (DUF368) [uncultured Roseburia sp.]|uniref:DUF368 domain-containing protein n=1 Tax=Brotonthovivens ammoniilytica TaxID=2981725 RepID=A0ABT2TIP1_9FIRM|nr:DUF368 domain-containing protein [Brotonthovivens ammoniilytica]MCU6761536.1 DUF368 domain-containing protein [Brotonthovivens ammoniilytica]SCI31240.1 Domain of uncharacterised function (DUF368) [uncultured Roseburia sp.]